MPLRLGQDADGTDLERESFQQPSDLGVGGFPRARS